GGGEAGAVGGIGDERRSGRNKRRQRATQLLGGAERQDADHGGDDHDAREQTRPERVHPSAPGRVREAKRGWTICAAGRATETVRWFRTEVDLSATSFHPTVGRLAAARARTRSAEMARARRATFSHSSPGRPAAQYG